MKVPTKPVSSINHCCLLCLRLICLGLLAGLTVGCVFGIVIPVESSRLHALHKAINDSPYKIVILDIEQSVPAHQSFRPTQHADVVQAPTVKELASLAVRELATVSAGMAITIHTHNQQKPLHGYLVVYPVYRSQVSPASYRVRISKGEIRQVRQGKTVRLHGHYPYRDSEVVSWVMWLSRESLDVDCGCA